MEIEPQVLSERIPSTADFMISTNALDDMANEQTWPTEEEMAGAATREEGMEGVQVPGVKKGTTSKHIKRIPKDMSEYQTAWVVDETDNEEYDEEEEVIAKEEEMVPVEMMDLESEKKSAVAFQDLDIKEEESQSDFFFSLPIPTNSCVPFRLQDWRNRAQEERDAQEFPDEIDTPRDIPVRERFARYRGLQSFRTSHGICMRIYPKNMLEYLSLRSSSARSGTCVGQQRPKVQRYVLFTHFDFTPNVLQLGTRVTVYVEGVPQEASVPSSALIVFYSLLKHEHKKRVLHSTGRNTEYSGFVKSTYPPA